MKHSFLDEKQLDRIITSIRADFTGPNYPESRVDHFCNVVQEYLKWTAEVMSESYRVQIYAAKVLHLNHGFNPLDITKIAPVQLPIYLHLAQYNGLIERMIPNGNLGNFVEIFQWTLQMKVMLGISFDPEEPAEPEDTESEGSSYI
jgi:hypothetical protein